MNLPKTLMTILSQPLFEKKNKDGRCISRPCPRHAIGKSLEEDARQQQAQHEDDGPADQDGEDGFFCGQVEGLTNGEKPCNEGQHSADDTGNRPQAGNDRQKAQDLGGAGIAEGASQFPVGSLSLEQPCANEPGH